MSYFASMVGHKENLANRIGLFDSSMGLKRVMVVMASLKMGVQIDFSIYHISEYYTVEAERKRLDPKTYLVA